MSKYDKEEVRVEFMVTHTVQVTLTAAQFKQAMANGRRLVTEPSAEVQDATEYVYELLLVNNSVDRDAYLTNLGNASGDVIDEDITIEEVTEP